MSHPTEIYLQPECCADPDTGPLWCEHDAPIDCEDGKPWTRYVRADKFDRLRRKLAILSDELATFRLGKHHAENAELRQELADARELLHQTEDKCVGLRRELAEARAKLAPAERLLRDIANQEFADEEECAASANRYLRQMAAADMQADKP